MMAIRIARFLHNSNPLISGCCRTEMDSYSAVGSFGWWLLGPAGFGGQVGAEGFVVRLVDEVGLPGPLVAQSGQQPRQPLAHVGEVHRGILRPGQLMDQAG